LNGNEDDMENKKKIKKPTVLAGKPELLQISFLYPGRLNSQTFDSEAFGLYKTTLLDKKDIINAIYVYIQYFHKEHLNRLFPGIL
jgi:hypothetical protein